jgi:hypothetical protein
LNCRNHRRWHRSHWYLCRRFHGTWSWALSDSLGRRCQRNRTCWRTRRWRFQCWHRSSTHSCSLHQTRPVYFSSALAASCVIAYFGLVPTVVSSCLYCWKHSRFQAQMPTRAKACSMIHASFTSTRTFRT